MNLNECQKTAKQEILRFLADPGRKYHRVSGAAGTGKTVLLADLAKTSGLPEVHLTATTHKAAEVLRSFTDRDASTVHSWLGLIIENDYDTGKSRITPTREAHPRCGPGLLCVDEASMVNRELMQFIGKLTTGNMKVLFTGDKEQLAPVGHRLSPVFDAPISESSLRETIRNRNSAALPALCRKARYTRDGREPFFAPRSHPGSVDLVSGESLKEILTEEFREEDSSKRILAYTNRRVIQYLDFLRDLRGYESPYEEDQIMVSNSTLFSPSKSEKVLFYADEKVRVAAKPVKNTHRPELLDLPVRSMESGKGKTVIVPVFADPAERRATLNACARNRKWEDYFRIRNCVGDFRGFSASTVHKAQGSTYHTVLVDLNDIGTCTHRDQIARMLYVAYSRATDRVIVKGSLPARLFADREAA